MNWDICFRIVADGENEDLFFLVFIEFLHWEGQVVCYDW